jgi:hypothetical protein
VAAARVDDQLVAALADGGPGPLEELGAERLDVGDDDAEHVGAAAAEAAGDEAGLVAEVVDDGLHPLQRGGSHPVAAVDHLRHGGDRHTRLGRYIADRHARHRASITTCQ